MKSNELMIGDWVTLNGVDYKWQWTHHDFTASEFNTLEPIPLSAEILEKNGFVNDASYDECVADYCFVTVQLWRYHGENILIDWDGITTRIANDWGNLCESIELRDAKVHDLQHALRLCGLTDLADNFRVD